MARQLFKPDKAHFDLLKRIYAIAPIHQTWKAEMEVGEGWAAVTTPVRPELLNPLGTLHGAIICKAIDTSLFFAANSLVPDFLVVTASLNVNFLRPVSQGLFVANATVVNASRRQIVAEALVVDESDRKIAFGSGTFAFTDIPLERAASS